MRHANPGPERPLRQRKPKPSKQQQSDTVPASRSRKRRSTDGPEDEGYKLSKRQRLEFAYLKPKTRQISQRLVTKQWRALPESAQQQVRAIVNAAKRSVTYSSRDLNRAQEAEKALERLLRLLHHRLPRMPFPKNSKDAHFDLDKILERNVC